MAKTIDAAVADMTVEQLRRLACRALCDAVTVLDEIDGMVDVKDGVDGPSPNWAMRLSMDLEGTLWSAGVNPSDPFGRDESPSIPFVAEAL